MKRINQWEIAAILIILTLNRPMITYCETIKLKSGKEIEGRILERTDKYIMIDFEGVSLTYYFDEIESIGSEVVMSKKESVTSPISTEPNKNNAEEYFKYVKQLIEEGKKEKAFAELKKAIELDPKFLEAYHLIGNFFVGAYFIPEGKTIELLNIFEQAIQNNPDDPESYYYLAISYEMIGRIFDARNAYQKVKELVDKGGALTYPVDFIEEDLKKVNERIYALEKEVGKIETMSQAEKVEVAKSCMEKAQGSDMEGIGKYSLYAINIAPDSPEVAMAYVNLANMYFSDEAADIVTYYYKKAIELKPDLAEAYAGLGSIKSTMGMMKDDQQQWEEAEKAFEKADTLLKKQEKTELSRELETMRSEMQSIKEDPEVKAFAHMDNAIKIATYEYDFKEAITECSKAIEIYPKAAAIYFFRGQLYFELGNYESALQDFTEASKLPSLEETYQFVLKEPGKIAILQNRMVTHLILNKYDLALKDCEEMISHDSKDALSYFMQANTYYYNNEYEKALKNYSAIIESKDTFVFESTPLYKCYLGRGNTYFKLGKYDLALSDYNSVIDEGLKYMTTADSKRKYFPDSANKAYIARAKFYFLREEKEEALKDLDEVIDKGQYQFAAMAYETKGDLLSHEGRYQEAAKNYADSIQKDRQNFNAEIYDKLAYVYEKIPKKEGFDYYRGIIEGKDDRKKYVERGGRRKLLIEVKLLQLKDYPQLEIPFKTIKKDWVEKTYWDDGSLKEEIPYKDGKIDGTVKKYYRNGNLMEETIYKNGEKGRNVFYTYWKDTNILRHEESSLNDVKDGPERHYYPDGKVQWEETYRNGKKEGIYKTFYDNGKLHQEINYKDDKAFGFWKEYDKEGSCVFESIPQDDGTLKVVRDERKRN